MGKNNRPVKVLQTGVTYPNVTAMAEEFGVTPSAVYKHINGSRGTSPFSLTIVWADDQESE